LSSWIDLRHRIAGLRGQRVHVVDAAREANLRSALAAEGFELVTVAGSAITSRAALFDEMARAFRFEKGFGHNFDALADALGDLADRDTARLAVLWVDAEATVAADLQTFLSAVLALDAAAVDLATIDGDGDARQLEVFLLGAGAGFASRE
jgi:RNAse (barnase) inhibitor barstar